MSYNFHLSVVPPPPDATTGPRTVGLESDSERRREITASARGIPLDSILQFDHAQFHVTSQSHPGTFYSVDLNLSTCDCQYFPRIRFCTHIAAIHHHFPHLCFEDCDPIIPVEDSPAPDQREGDPNSDPEPYPEFAPTPQETLRLLTQEISSLSQDLAAASKNISRSSHAAVLEAMRSAKDSLTAAVATGASTYCTQSQSSWGAMGIKRARKRTCLPEEHGVTERAIGVPIRKCRRTDRDPYAGVERSGTRAKPDALSAEANRRARACVPSSATAPHLTPRAPAAMAGCMPQSNTVPLPSAATFTRVPHSSIPAPLFAAGTALPPSPSTPD